MVLDWEGAGWTEGTPHPMHSFVYWASSVLINSNIPKLQPQKLKKLGSVSGKGPYLSSCSPFLALCHKAIASESLSQGKSLLSIFPAGSCKGEALRVFSGWLILQGYFYPAWWRGYSPGIEMDCCAKMASLDIKCFCCCCFCCLLLVCFYC